MNLNRYIQNHLPIVELGDHMSEVYELLETYETLPIVSEGKYLGVVTLHEISNITKDEEGIFSLDGHTLFKPQLQQDQHPIDAIKVLQSTGLGFIPITDKQDNYLGTWDGVSVEQYYLSSEGLMAEGAAVILEIEPRNYSLSEIAQICETNNKKVLGLDIHTNEQNDTLLVSLYLEEPNIGDLISALERYGYNIYHTIGYQDNQDRLKENFDVLMSYLDI